MTLLCSLFSLLHVGAFGRVERGVLVTEKNGYSMEVEVAIKSLKGELHGMSVTRDWTSISLFHCKYWFGGMSCWLCSHKVHLQMLLLGWVSVRN